MSMGRLMARIAEWLGGISWLLRLNRRLRAAATRWKLVRLTLAMLAAVTRNDAQQLVAGVAYYGIVALIPVSVALLQFLGYALGEERSWDWFESWSSRLLPPNVDLSSLVATSDPTAISITGVFVVLGLIWGSYKLFGAVGLIVNRMWGIEPSQVGIIGKTRQYFLMSGTAMALFVSSIFTYVISQDLAPLALRELQLVGLISTPPVVISQWWYNGFAALLSGFAFLVVYRYVPERPVSWRWAVIGAIVAGVALQLVNYGVVIFILYLAPSHLVYGPLASVLVILMWLFASSVTLAMGAAASAYGQSVYDGDGPTPGPGWFLT